MTNLLRAELYKLRRTPTTWIFATLAVATSIAGAVLVLSIVDMPVGSDATELMSFSGAAGLVCLLFGLVWSAGERRHHTLVPSLLVAPLRWPVTAAQLLALGAVGAVIGLLTGPVTLAIGMGWLGVADIDFRVPVDGLIGAWLGGALYTGLSCVLGGGLGALARNQVAAAIGAFVYLSTIDPLLAQAVPAYGQVGPTALGIAISGGSPQEGGPGAQLLAPLLAIAVYIGYTALFSVGGLVATLHGEEP